MAHTSHSPREWRWDASSCSFVTDSNAAIRVLTVSAEEAARLKGVREQAEDLYTALYESANRPVAHAKSDLARAFDAPADDTHSARPTCIVLAFYDAEGETKSDRVEAYSHVYYDGEYVNISSIAVSRALPDDIRQQALRAMVLATEGLAVAIAHDVFPGEGIVSRGQVGASDVLKNLFEAEGYSPQVLDRVLMTASLSALGSVDAAIESCGVDGVAIRPLNLLTDDLRAVVEVVKDAFGPHLSFEAWKYYYAQQPRFAPDMSFVAWKDDKPIAIVLIELLVDGEGGGEAEVERVCSGGSVPMSEANSESIVFPDDYDERRQRIRTCATTGYVCGVATIAPFRGKRLAQTLLRHAFQAAARAGIESIVLGTDSTNHAAVRAYTRVGMAVTETKNSGLYTGRQVTSSRV